jgi:hypothetical protein
MLNNSNRKHKTIKKELVMSNDEAEALMDAFERKWKAKQKREFIGRMERKLSHKEHEAHS